MDRGPKDHINIRISHSGSTANISGIQKMMFRRILMFMWSLGALVEHLWSQDPHCRSFGRRPGNGAFMAPECYQAFWPQTKLGCC